MAGGVLSWAAEKAMAPVCVRYETVTHSGQEPLPECECMREPEECAYIEVWTHPVMRRHYEGDARILVGSLDTAMLGLGRQTVGRMQSRWTQSAKRSDRR